MSKSEATMYWQAINKHLAYLSDLKQLCCRMAIDAEQATNAEEAMSLAEITDWFHWNLKHLRDNIGRPKPPTGG